MPREGIDEKSVNLSLLRSENSTTDFCSNRNNRKVELLAVDGDFLRSLFIYSETETACWPHASRRPSESAVPYGQTGLPTDERFDRPAGRPASARRDDRRISERMLGSGLSPSVSQSVSVSRKPNNEQRFHSERSLRFDTVEAAAATKHRSGLLPARPLAFESSSQFLVCTNVLDESARRSFKS